MDGCQPRRPRFGHRSDRVGFVVDKVNGRRANLHSIDCTVLINHPIIDIVVSMLRASLCNQLKNYNMPSFGKWRRVDIVQTYISE
jgi:hypothetical protein